LKKAECRECAFEVRMVRKIEILPESVSQMIAAGEVVERPASVVKELMENAIDAEAREIIVELKAGGLQLIRVADDGEGMGPEDVPLALRRFATSKIRKPEDLYAIDTLGFRGEALPSIASVSRMVIKTRVSHSISGTKVVCEGGEIRDISEIGCPVGTEVEVKNLFYNIPVKRKFLKSIRSEYRYALHHFLRVSLSHTSISFKLIHDGRMVQELLSAEAPLIRMEAILGRETAHHLQEIKTEEEGIRLSGFISLPPFIKGSAEGIYIHINRRYVRDRIIYKAVLEAYRHHLPNGKFPVTVLFITLHPSSVDVNVHPTKAEVKFKDPERIYQLVFAAITNTIEKGFPQRLESISSKSGEGIQEGGKQEPAFLFDRPWNPGREARGEAEIEAFAVREKEPRWEEDKRVPFRIVGQIWGTYILCETGGNLIFIDQHAAHERILFEKFKREYENRSLRSNPLLMPILMECSAEEFLVLETAGEAFKAIGFELEPAGEKLYAIRAIPSLIDPKDSEEWIREILRELSFLKKGGEGRTLIQSLLISLSCHSAVRGKDVLRREEIEELVKSLYPFHTSVTCPHGRPILFLLPQGELNRQFKRRREG